MAFPPKMVSRGDDPNDFFCLADFVLNLVFLLEFLIKFGAYGLAYFNDTWNILDFVVVFQGVFAMLSECPNSNDTFSLQFGDISALRMIRILRPLKSLRRFPEMRLLVTSLFGSFHLLLAIIGLTSMAIFVMGIFTSFYFGDALDYRCLPDPYYDPFSGTFAANPNVYANGSSRLDLNVSVYWASRDDYREYEDLVHDDRTARDSQFRFLATNFWKSASMYRDYMRDTAATTTKFPYLASFCGGCKTCRRCEQCYSDDETDGCLSIDPYFFRRYGYPKQIAKDFHGAAPATAIQFLEGNVSRPLSQQQLRGVPVTHADSASAPFAFLGLPNVTYIREYCVDLKKGDTAEFLVAVDDENTVIEGPEQYAAVTTPDKAYLDLGWQVLTRFTERLDLSDPRFRLESLLFKLKNCAARRRPAKKALRELQGINPQLYPEGDSLNSRSCERRYAGKTGERRHGIFGRPRPRKRRYLWYHQYDASLWSVLAIFDIMNMENWNDAMWAAQMSVGKYTWPIFYAIISVVNICLLNLFPAVMSFNLRKGIREEENRNAADAKLAFMGTDLLSMTQFEEHMIDILAAEEEEAFRVRSILKRQGASVGDGVVDAPVLGGLEIDPLEGVPCVPRGSFYDALRHIVLPDAGPFSIFIYVCIFLNIVVMSQTTLHVNNKESRRRTATLNLANGIFVVIFVLEALIKNVALGPVAYFRDNYNKFDFVLAILGIVDVAAQTIENGTEFSLLRLIRITRVARVFRLASISRIKPRAGRSGDLDFFRLMSVISLSATWIINILGLLFLTLYTASIVSMQIFGNEVYTLNDYSGQWVDKGRLNFDSFPMAFITSFIVLSGDEWNTIMYNTMRRSGSVACLFFIVLIVIGKYAILSMLTAIIFEEVERESISVIKQAVRTTMLSVFKFERAMMSSIYRYHFFKWYANISARKIGDSADQQRVFREVTLLAPPPPPLTRFQKFINNDKSYLIFPNPEKPLDAPAEQEDPDVVSEEIDQGKTPLGRFRRCMQVIGRSALFANFVFVAIMVSIIVLARFYEIRNSTNTSFLSAQEERTELRIVQGACTIVFVAEFLIMTIGETLFGYLSQPMNALDALVTSISVISLNQRGLSPFAVIRVVRIIRPLKKLVRSSPSVMSVLSALESSAKGVMAVAFLAVMLWLTIAVIGLQLFQGRLFYCSASLYPEGGLLKAYRPDRNRFAKGSNKFEDWPDEQFTYINERLDAEVAFPPMRAANNSRGCKLFEPVFYEQYNRNDDIVEAEGTFRIKKSVYNFDNLYEAFRSAFLVFSFDNWHKLVLATMNAKTTGPYLNHEAEASTAVPAIFFFFAGCTSFLLNTLFVGVIYGTFTYRMLVTDANAMRRRLASLKDIQWRVYELKLSCIKALQEPQNPNSTNLFLRNLYAIFRHRYYKVVYAVLVLADVLGWWLYVGSKVRLAPRESQERTIQEDDNSQLLRAVRTADHAFCFILVSECVLKLTTFGWFTMLALATEQLRVILHIPIIVFLSLDLSDSWNSLRKLDIARNCNDNRMYPNTCDGGALQRFVYGLRTFQVFLVVPAFVELRTIAYALYAALGTTLPMLLLMVISTFAFAVVGMMFLGEVDLSKRDSDGDPELFGSNWFQTRLKFRTISKSMSTLFLAATANSWISIKDVFEKEVGVALKGVNVVFWLVHVVIIRYLFLNVFTMIFIYKYESTSPVQPWIAMDQVEEFLRAWQQFDEFGVGRIRTKYLARLLRLLSPPLGMTRDAPQLLADRHAKRILMAIPLLLESEIERGEANRLERWEQIQESFIESHVPGHPRSGNKVAKISKLPRYLEFTDVIKAVHRVVIFSELQALPDDDDGSFTKRREFAQAKLDILRLAIHRFSDQHFRAPGTGGQHRTEKSVQDMSLMQRLCPDVYRYRMRQALTLETHRWQCQVELSKFDDESFHECELLLAIIGEEKVAAEMQLQVLNTLAAKGLLNAFQERRPKLHRHISFLTVLQQRIWSERSKHVRKAWMASSVFHCGTLPAAGKVLQSKAENLKNGSSRHRHRGERIVSSIAASLAGDVLVSAHGGSTITVWRKRKEKKSTSAVPREVDHHETKEAPRDPWNTTPFFKAQVIEDTARVLAVAMTKDGRRVYLTSANNIKCYMHGKKMRGQSGVRYSCESVMVGHAAPVNALQISHRYVFSTGDDGTIKMWRLRSNEAQQSGTITYSNRCMCLCVINTARSAQDEDHSGLHALVGLDSGALSILPFLLNAQWLQGAVWRPKLTESVFKDEPITACSYAFRNVYCGGATGNIAVLRPIRGDEDLKTLERVAEEMKNEGLQLKDLNSLTRNGNRALRSKTATAATLSQIVRLEHLYRLNCHTQAITGFCIAGELFFTCSRDMSIVSWQRPMEATNRAIHIATAGNTLTDEQKYLSARIVHRAPITSMATAGDFLVTADEEGSILVHAAEKYREIIHSIPSDPPSQQSLEVEVIEKPAFFTILNLSKVRPRHFMAQILAHYYPIKAVSKPSKMAYTPADRPEDDEEIDPRPIDPHKQDEGGEDTDDADAENLDDAFDVVGAGEDEDEDDSNYSGDEEDEDFEDADYIEEYEDEYEDDDIEVEDYEEYQEDEEYSEDSADEDEDELDEEDELEEDEDEDFQQRDRKSVGPY